MSYRSGQTQRCLIIGCLAGGLLCAYADKGDTISESRSKYGTEVGRVDAKGQTVLIYQTPSGRITEVYNDQGICIESDAQSLAVEKRDVGAMAETAVESPVTANAVQPPQQKVPDAGSAEPAGMQSTDADLESGGKSGGWKMVLPVLIIIAAAGLISRMLFRSRQSSALCL